MIKQIDRYVIVSQIGVGTFGPVYKAVDPLIRRQVAIKTIKKELLSSADNPDLLKQFHNNAQAIAQIHHPNIVSIFEYGEYRGEPFVVTSYAEGRDLKSYFDNQEEFSLEDSLSIMRQLLDALEFSHTHNLYHRYIKPSNIIFHDDKSISLTSLSFSHLKRSMPLRSDSAPYISPEQLNGEEVDARTDIFLAGVLFYQLLTNEEPFSGMTRLAIIRNILSVEPTPPSHIDTNISTHYDTTILKSLSKKREDRYATAMDFLHNRQSAQDGNTARSPLPEDTPVTLCASAEPWYDDMTTLVLPPSTEDFKHPLFTSYFPSVLQPRDRGVVMIYVHIESAYQQVLEHAEQIKEIIGSETESTTVKASSRIDSNAVLTIVPQFEELQFMDSEKTLVWNIDQDRKEMMHVSFPFMLQKKPGKQIIKGQVTVYKNALLLGRIPITIHVQQDAAVKDRDVKASMPMLPYNKIFVSYSHNDSTVMEYCRKTNDEQQAKMLIDIHDLRSGDCWSERLLEMIEESDAFQLIWSKDSAKSEYCRQEWRHALSLADAGDHFIQPVWWSPPMPQPPKELAHLHFAKIHIPLKTKSLGFFSRIFRRRC